VHHHCIRTFVQVAVVARGLRQTSNGARENVRWRSGFFLILLGVLFPDDLIRLSSDSNDQDGAGQRLHISRFVAAVSSMV
jgi:hypothetical protein